MDETTLREIALQITMLMPREEADCRIIRSYVTELLAWRNNGKPIGDVSAPETNAA